MEQSRRRHRNGNINKNKRLKEKIFYLKNKYVNIVRDSPVIDNKHPT